MSNWKRPEVPVTLAFIRQHTNFIEWVLLAGSIKSLDFHRKIRNYVCPRIPAKDHFRADFQNPEFYIAYCEVALYWAQFDYLPKLPRDFELGIIAFEQLLLEKVEKGKVARQRAVDILEEVKMDLEVVFNAAEYDAIIESDTFRIWQKSRVEADIQKRIATPGITPVTIESVKEMARQGEGALVPTASKTIRGDALFSQRVKYLPSVSSGFPSLDKAMGGGFHQGAVTMIGGATGTGKSVLAATLLLNMANNGEVPLLITTERPPINYMHRMASNYLRINYNTFTNRTDVVNTTGAEIEVPSMPVGLDTDPNIAPRMASFRQLLSGVVFEDWADGGGRTIVQDFDRLVERIGREMYNPRIILLDWLGGGLEAKAQTEQIREIYIKAVKYLVNHAKKHNRAIIVFAQLDKILSRKQGKFPDHTALCESKNMVDEVTTFVGISGLVEGDEHKGRNAVNQYLNVSKATFGEPASIPVTAEFEYQRFVEKRGPGGLRVLKD